MLLRVGCVSGSNFVHPPLLLLSVGEGGAVESPTKFSKRGRGLTGTQFLEGGCWERGVDFFQRGGMQFFDKK